MLQWKAPVDPKTKFELLNPFTRVMSPNNGQETMASGRELPHQADAQPRTILGNSQVGSIAECDTSWMGSGGQLVAEGTIPYGASIRRGGVLPDGPLPPPNAAPQIAAQTAALTLGFSSRRRVPPPPQQLHRGPPDAQLSYSAPLARQPRETLSDGRWRQRQRRQTSNFLHTSSLALNLQEIIV